MAVSFLNLTELLTVIFRTLAWLADGQGEGLWFLSNSSPSPEHRHRHQYSSPAAKGHDSAQKSFPSRSDGSANPQKPHFPPRHQLLSTFISCQEHFPLKTSGAGFLAVFDATEPLIPLQAILPYQARKALDFIKPQTRTVAVAFGNNCKANK